MSDDSEKLFRIETDGFQHLGRIVHTERNIKTGNTVYRQKVGELGQKSYLLTSSPCLVPYPSLQCKFTM